jgi:hypothetical protein
LRPPFPFYHPTPSCISYFVSSTVKFSYYKNKKKQKKIGNSPPVWTWWNCFDLLVGLDD